MSRRRAKLTALMGGALAVALLAALRLWPARPMMDPRALALLQANDERLQTLRSASGVVEKFDGATSRESISFRVMRPAFTRIRTDNFEKKPGRGAAWLPSGYSSQSRSDGKTIWYTAQSPGGKRRGARFPASPREAGVNIPLFFAGMFRNELTHYGWLLRDPANNDRITVRYEGVHRWRGASYEAVRISGEAHNDLLPWEGVMRGRFSPVTWARVRLAAVPVSHHYEYYLLVGADHLIHRQIFAMREGGPSSVVNDIQLRSVQINPPLSPADFRYASPRGSGAVKP